MHSLSLSLPTLPRPRSSRRSSTKSSSSSSSPYSLPSQSLHIQTPYNTPHPPISATPFPHHLESDAQVWCKMLSLQRQYHCYNSARIEAAVEALDKRGYKMEDLGVPSRLCLDLLNEELNAQLAAAGYEV